MTMMGAKLMALGAAAALPLALSVKSFVSQGDALDKMSQRTGIAVKALSEMAYVADLSGANLQAYEKAVMAMSKAIRSAGQGLQTQMLALKDIGLEYKDLEGLSPDKQFILISEALSRVTDEGQKAAISQELFSRAGKQLLPMMKLGTAGMEAMRAKARALGITMSGSEAKAAAKLKDDMTSLWYVLKRAAFTIGSALAPAINSLAEWLAPVITKRGPGSSRTRNW